MTPSKAFKRLYFVLKANWFIWSRIANRAARKLLIQHPPALTPYQKGLLDELQVNGIVVTSLADLFPEGPALSELQGYAESLESDADMKTKKFFLRHYWDLDAPLDLENPFVRLSLTPQALALANSYMGMYSRLKYYGLNLTIPVPETEEPQFSQRWHRDPQEKRMIKIFIYLSDVDEDSGPFTYVSGSTYGNKYGHHFPQHPPEGNYPALGTVEKIIDPRDIRVITGVAGTVLLCDTTGLHRGGYATKHERLMFTAFYASSSYREDKRYTTNKIDVSQLSREAQFATAGN